ncbi:S8 family serine peptidase [Cryomorphaceae bacterium 1068]|nr:S8 family serine peptidase [Cryomorphaceae bacterium 1068]
MVLNRWFPVGVLFCLVSTAFSQVGENRYLVYFEDKEGTPFSVYEPEAFLSERAITRRIDQNIPITEEDLPVNPEYIDQVRELGDLEVIYSLKWFNAILIETDDQDVIDAILDLEMVVGTQISPVLRNDQSLEIETDESISSPKNNYAYGPSFNQINMINGIPLHEAGYTGEGVWIGVFDGGYSFAQQDLSLQNLVNSDRILGTKNFVDGNDDVYQRSTHGSYVLSAMAGYLDDSLIGTAPDASYLLCITEDVPVERRIEEVNWAAAAEYADSIGIDVINTSLGYTLFDLEDEDHSYETLDGNTTLITRASNIAASKGILVVTSAGNSGNSPWYYIGAPADGDHVLAVGAVRPDETVASLSSRGPRVDGAVKPNVMAQGIATVVGNLGDGIRTANGTSFSSPVMAGMAASLWQAVPQATAEELFDAIEQSASLYLNPNDSLGYGIPDFEFALSLLQTLTSFRNTELGGNDLGLYPNPRADDEMLNVLVPEEYGAQITLEVYDITGKRLFSQRLSVFGGRTKVESIPVFTSGIYLVTARGERGQKATSKLIIQ